MKMLGKFTWVALIGCLTSTMAIAAELHRTGATVVEVRPDGWQDGGMILLISGGTTSGTPACSASGLFFANLTHDSGPLVESFIAIAQSAKLAGKKITVHGNGVCTPAGSSPNYEGIRYLHME